MKHLEDIQDQIEEMVDKTDVQTVLECLARVCFEKQEHILINWQDKARAEQWEQSGKQIMQAFSKINL